MTPDKILEDGETLRVPLMMMDSMQRTIAANAPKPTTKADAYANYKDRLTNAWKDDHDTDEAVEVRRQGAEPSSAYRDYVQRTVDAWKGA